MTQEEVVRRQSWYRCCSLGYFDKWVEGAIHGDKECAEKNYNLALYMGWAADVMCDECVDLGFKAQVAAKADCYCDLCGCPEEPERTCAITPDIIVIAVIPQSELPIPCSINLDWNNDFNNDFNADIPCVNVQPGNSYFITSGAWSGAVVTWKPEPDFNNDFNNDFNAQQ